MVNFCYQVQVRSACLMTGQNPTDEVEASNTTLFREPTDREDGRLHVSNNHLPGLDASFSYESEVEGQGREQNKRPLIPISPKIASFRQEDVFISFFLPSADGQSSF